MYFQLVLFQTVFELVDWEKNLQSVSLMAISKTSQRVIVA